MNNDNVARVPGDTWASITYPLESLPLNHKLELQTDTEHYESKQPVMIDLS